MKSKVKTTLLQILFFLVIFYTITQFQQRNMLENHAPAPYFNLPLLNTHERLSIDQIRGQKTVIYFFAPWCSICKISMPNHDKLHANGSINAIAIAADYTSIQAVKDFTRELNLSMPVLLGDKNTASNYKVSAFPTYYIISDELKITNKSLGYSTELGLLARTL